MVQIAFWRTFASVVAFKSLLLAISTCSPPTKKLLQSFPDSTVILPPRFHCSSVLVVVKVCRK